MTRRLLMLLSLASTLSWASLAPVSAAPSSSPRGAALELALKTKRLKRVEFKDRSLKDLITWLRVATGWNILAHPTALTQAGIDVATLSFSADFEDLAVGTLLEVLLEPYQMTVRVKDNLLFVTSKADAMGRLLTRVYGISHITWQKIDFIAPDVNLNPSGMVTEEYEPEVIREDDALNNGEAVAELVKEIVEPGLWETDGWSIRATNTYMIVRAPASVHQRIPNALDTISTLK